MHRLLAIAAFALVAIGPSTALAQAPTFFTVSYVEVGPILAKVGASTLKTYRDAARKEKGNIHLDLLESVHSPNQFVALGAWADQAAYDAHKDSAPFKALSDKLQSMMIAPMDVRPSTALSVTAAVAPDKSAKDAIVVITHIDVVGTHKDDGAAALKQLADDSRQHPGNLQFHVWQQAGRPNHFTVIEAWNNRGAFNVHQMRSETRGFRGKLAPMLGALYDDRIFKPLK